MSRLKELLFFSIFLGLNSNSPNLQPPRLNVFGLDTLIYPQLRSLITLIFPWLAKLPNLGPALIWVLNSSLNIPLAWLPHHSSIPATLITSNFTSTFDPPSQWLLHCFSPRGGTEVGGYYPFGDPYYLNPKKGRKEAKDFYPVFSFHLFGLGSKEPYAALTIWQAKLLRSMLWTPFQQCANFNLSSPTIASGWHVYKPLRSEYNVIILCPQRCNFPTSTSSISNSKYIPCNLVLVVIDCLLKWMKAGNLDYDWETSNVAFF